MISQKSKYALRSLLALARAKSGEAVRISGIAAGEKIPKKFLEQILLDLKHHGIVTSRRGRSGGYLLLRPAHRISFGDVLRVLEGPVAPLPCLSRTAYRKCDDCGNENLCEIRKVFAQVASRSRDILDNTTLADCLADPQFVRADPRLDWIAVSSEGSPAENATL
ncbi:MAG: Rrf2 family transcriptional regulator [Shinella sp.]|nr:Rrf2 family transcriptional regulator [Shinella sp.]